jgi:hypothetical protein
MARPRRPEPGVSEVDRFINLALLREPYNIAVVGLILLIVSLILWLATDVLPQGELQTGTLKVI